MGDDGTDTRTRILDAALEQFFERGYDGTTTRAIAEGAEVNEVTLFRNFGSKEGIFLAVVQRETDVFHNLEEFDLTPSGDLVGDLAMAGTHITKNMVERARLVKIIMTEAGRNPKVWEVVGPTPFAVLDRIARFFEEARERGLMRDLDPRLVAVAYFSFFFRTMVANAFLGRDVFLDMDEEHIRGFADVFVNGIAPREV